MSRFADVDVILDTVFEVHCKECERRKGIKNGKLKVIYEVGEAPCKSCGVNDMREYIEDAPTADVAPVTHGEWVDGYKRQSCSVCHYRGMRSWNYCPNCGAKMDLREVKE